MRGDVQQASGGAWGGWVYDPCVWKHTRTALFDKLNGRSAGANRVFGAGEMAGAIGP
jgi:hypothetical protein